MEEPPGMPRWVKVGGLLALLLVLALLAVHLLVGGPWRHGAGAIGVGLLGGAHPAARAGLGAV